ncbi:MAG: hypothetical protein CVV27_03400 [Candidatus Melainabacteria bacterium HGW-Melainabacteria-1]|nr:MAG: hypothetical protein CVV27_03400 [Candidatus Melainabacteria bacterium HGW-Melainabacteria-1]
MEQLQQDASGTQAEQRHAILLFDGVCNVCNGAVNFIIDHDPDGYFKFASLQSEAGQDLLKRFKLPTADFNTMVLIEHNSYHIKSDAALRIARRLKGPLSLAYIGVIVPRFVRDKIYDLIASNRYQWFGKRDQCRLPTPAIRARFL